MIGPIGRKKTAVFPLIEYGQKGVDLEGTWRNMVHVLLRAGPKTGGRDGDLLIGEK